MNSKVVYSIIFSFKTMLYEQKCNNIWFANTVNKYEAFLQQYSFYIVSVKIFLVNLNL